MLEMTLHQPLFVCINYTTSENTRFKRFCQTTVNATRLFSCLAKKETWCLHLRITAARLVQVEDAD